MPCEKPTTPTTRPPEARIRRTAERTTSSTSGGRSLGKVTASLGSRVTFRPGESQPLKGPQPSKKGRTPGPAAESKGPELILAFYFSCF